MRIHPVVLFSFGLALHACGGGGGGDGGGGNGGGNAPPPSTALSTPSMLLDGPSYAESGVPYQAQLSLPMAEQGSLDDSSTSPLTLKATASASFTLVQGPTGLTLDEASGAIDWTPSEGQAGEQAIVVHAQSGATDLTETLKILVQGKHLDASQFVSAASGGTVEVIDSASALAGSKIVIPPGALAQDQQIQVHSLVQPVALPPTALGIELSPSQNFLSPVSLQIKYTDAWLAQLGVSDESKLALYYHDDATGEWSKMAGSSVNAASNTITVNTTHFSSFAGFVGDPGALGPGPDGADFGKMWQLFVGGSGAPAPSDSSAYLAMWGDFHQERAFIQVKGGHFRPDQKNALLIHGIFSGAHNFPALQSWASARYDNVIFYNYPSARPIRENAMWLLYHLFLEQGEEALGSSVDVYAHSMGGLVARAVIEDPNLNFGRIVMPFVHLAMLGTPNRGGLFPWYVPDWLVNKYQGAIDMRPGSDFLDHFLNVAPGQGWSKYYVIAGDKGSGDDGYVATNSAIPTGIFTISEGGVTSPQGHSDIHQQMNTNGVANNLASWIFPSRMAADQIHFVSKDVHVESQPLGPFDYETEYESIEVTGHFAFDSDFFLPPLMPIFAVWKPVGGGWDCNAEELDKAHLYVDGDGFPQLLAILQQYPAGTFDNPLMQPSFFTGQPGPTISFHRKDMHVPLCYPAGYIPQAGVNGPPPTYQLWLYVGSEEDPILTAGPF